VQKSTFALVQTDLEIRMTWLTLSLVIICSLLSITAESPPRFIHDPTKLGATLIFSDDFDTFSWYPNGGTWQTWYYFGAQHDPNARTLAGNGELEYYSDSSVGVNPFSVKNSILYIEAKPGANLPVNSKGVQLKYTSGCILSEPTFSTTYGLFEMKAMLPWGKGLWPAFWLLPTDKAWPPEIDALEAFGAPNSRNEGYNNEYHYGCISNAGSFGNWVKTPNNVNVTSDFHKYSVLWTKDTLTYYFDSQQVAQGKTPADLVNRTMYLIANLAVGGNWPESPNDQTKFPVHLAIDYIKAWSWP